MLHPFFQFFNKSRPYIDPDSSQWPKEWSIIEFKSYSRLQQIKLPKPTLDKISLENVILNRKSEREFSGNPLNLKQLSSLLFFGAGITHKNKDPNLTRRAYPSGGARYPLEVYLAVLNVDGLTPGFYHYNVKKHSLELILKEKSIVLRNLFHDDFVKKSGAIFIFSMIPKRSTIKYGDFALKIGLIETGHLAENIYLAAQSLKLKCCSLGNLNESLAHRLLDLDGSQEITFYALAVGL